MRKLIVLMSLILTSLIVGVGFGSVLDINPLIPAAVCFVGSFIPLPAGSCYMLVYTSPAVAATYQFNLTYLPEFFTWNDAGAPITLFRVETQEDGVLHEYNAAAIAAANGYMMQGAQAANQVTLTIADGYIDKKNVTVTVTIAAAAAIAFFANSDNVGAIPYMFKNAAILALNPTDFSKFTALFIPALVAATSRVEVEFKDGHRQTFAVADLLSLSSFYQEVPGVIVNNIQSYIHKATVVSVAAVASYVLSVVLPKE
jgi:VCBS repeat-containing protein